MGTRGRRGGSRPKHVDSAGTNAVESAGTAPVTAPPISEADAEVVEVGSTTIVGGHGARVGRSLAGAVFGTLLVAGLAFGAALGPGGALGPKDDGAGAGSAVTGNDGSTADGDTSAADGSEHHDGDAPRDDQSTGGDGSPDESAPDETGTEPGGDAPTATEEPAETEKPASEPTAKPEPDGTPKPEPKPEPTKPPVESISLTVWIGDDRPVMEWSACEGLDFDAYKVVRSTDSTVSWPLGENDTLIAVVERGGYRKAWDSDAPGGTKVWYRVFCVRHTDDGYKVLLASAAKGIEVPEAPAPPDPISLDLSASLNEEGHVVLDWSACEADGFGAYKVLRSTSSENPSYLPPTEGTAVIGVIEDKGVTEFHDAGGDAGQTVYYRVQCIGWINGSKVLLGQTEVVAVTMP